MTPHAPGSHGGIPLKTAHIALATLVLLGTFALAPATATTDASVPVIAAGFSFLSPVIVVPVGVPITWSATLFPHTVTTTDANPIGDGNPNDPANADTNADTFSAPLPQGASFTHAFSTGGVFNYRCDIHHRLGMVGTVIVIDTNLLP